MCVSCFFSNIFIFDSMFFASACMLVNYLNRYRLCAQWFISGVESDSQTGWTALMRAAARGHADCARLLIDAGADKDARNNVRVGRCLAPSCLFSHFLTVVFDCAYCFLVI